MVTATRNAVLALKEPSETVSVSRLVPHSFVLGSPEIVRAFPVPEITRTDCGNNDWFDDVTLIVRFAPAEVRFVTVNGIGPSIVSSAMV